MKTLKSNCCKAPVKIGGEHTTHYYICTKCKKSCDVLKDKFCPIETDDVTLEFETPIDSNQIKINKEEC
jgi:hypothetical protein